MANRVVARETLEGNGFHSCLNQRICQHFQVSCDKTRVWKTLSFLYNSSEDQDNLRKKGKKGKK